MVGFRSSLAAVTVSGVVAVWGSAALAQSAQGTGFSPSSPVAAVVKVRTPWYAPKFVVAGKMRDTIPLYQGLDGLNFKAFSFARADGHFGGLYLWKDSAAAQSWFTPQWFERVERERGAPASVRFFEVLLALDNTPGGTPSQSDSTAVATVVEIPIPAGIPKERIAEGFAATLTSFQKVPGLLRKYFITTSDGKFGGIYHWKDEASARAWFTDAWGERVRREYGQPATVEWFDTPILLKGKEANGPWIRIKEGS